MYLTLCFFFHHSKLAVAHGKGFLCHVSFIFIPVSHTWSDSAAAMGKKLLCSGLIQHTAGLSKVKSLLFFHGLCLSLVFSRIQTFRGRLLK